MPRFRRSPGGSSVARIYGVSSVVRALLAFSIPLALAATASAQQSDTDGETAMLARINALRAEAGLAELTRDEHLDAAARTHSVDMAWHQMVEHVSPRTGTPADRVNATGLTPTGLAENIAFNHTAAQAQEGLEASAPHKQNMLAAGMTHVGISVVFADGGVYATQVFATLGPAPAQQEEAPPAEEPEEPEAIPTMPPPAPVPATAPPPAPVADAPQAQPPGGQQAQQASQSSQPIAVSNGQRIVGYWVLSAGRWYYYPMPLNARPGQRLQPDLSVTSGPPAAVLERHQQLQAQQQHTQVTPQSAQPTPVRPPPPVYRWRVRM